MRKKILIGVFIANAIIVIIPAIREDFWQILPIVAAMVISAYIYADIKNDN